MRKDICGTEIFSEWDIYSQWTRRLVLIIELALMISAIYLGVTSGWLYGRHILSAINLSGIALMLTMLVPMPNRLVRLFFIFER